MARAADLLVRAQQRKALRFREFVTLMEAAGFRLSRTRGSHKMFKHPSLPGHLNVQPDGRDAKPYQVKQFLDMIDKHEIEVVTR